MKTLSERLVWAREQKGLRDQMDFTQTDLAQRAGVTQGAIGHLESGRIKTSRKVATLATVLGVNARWLADGLGDPFARAVAAPTDETWIQRTNSDESRLLSLYRGTDADGKTTIIRIAETMPAIELPALAANDKP